MKTILLFFVLIISVSLQSCSPDMLDDINDDSRPAQTVDQSNAVPAGQLDETSQQ